MKKIISMVLMFSLLLLSAFALQENAVSLSTHVSDIKAQVVGKELAGAPGSLFGNERINVHVALDSGKEHVVGVVTKNKKVELIDEKELDNPTLNVYTSESVIRTIVVSHDQLGALQQALQDKTITYTAVGFFNKIKFSFVSLFAKFGKKGIANEKTVVPDAKPAIKVDEKMDVAEKAKVETVVKVQQKGSGAADTTGQISPTGAVVTNSAGARVDTEKPTMTKLREATEVSVPLQEKENEVVHEILITKSAFDPNSVTVHVGDIVEWKNVRDAKDRLNKAMVVGGQQCYHIKSKILASGEMYRWKADRPETCTIVEGISAVQISTLVVEK